MLCPVFVTDIVVGGLVAGLISEGTGGRVDVPVDTDGDPVDTGGATGLGVCEVCGSLNCTPDVLCFLE